MSVVCHHCGVSILPGQLGGLCPRCVAARLANDSAAEGLPSRVGDHEIIAELGRGTMGVVYLARHLTLERLVALKVVLAGAHGGEAVERRFLAEARLAAGLQHPNLVPVFEVGRDGKVAFYTMEFIEGENLSERLARGRLDPRSAADLVLQISQGIAYAHRVGVIHRDVKPSNILLDEKGMPRLSDFGLATPLDGQGWLTQPGEALGSPAFMAPEQLAGEVTASSDVYALGAVLYFALTGRAPFSASRLPDLISSIQNDDPLPPRRLDASIAHELSLITLKALQKAPAQRYSSATALAEDLQRWLDGHPVLARPPSLARRAKAWCVRNPLVAASVFVALGSVVTGTALVTREWRVVARLAAAREADLYAADLKLASEALERGDLAASSDLLQECPRALRDAAWGLLHARSVGSPRELLASGSHTVVDLAYAPSVSLLVAAEQVGPVLCYDTRARTLRELPDTRNSWNVAFSRDGGRLLTAGNGVKVWNVSDFKLLRSFPGRSGALSPDGRRVAACEGHRFLYEGTPGPVTLWDPDQASPVARIPGEFRLAAWSPDGRLLALSDAANFVSLYDGETGQPLGAPWPSVGGLWSLAFSPDARLLVGSGWGRDVRVWETAAPGTAPRLLTHPLSTWTAVFSPDGERLAVTGSDRRSYLWDTKTWTLSAALSGQRDEVWSATWESPSSLVTSGRDAQVLRWLETRPAPSATIKHDDPGYTPVWLADGTLAILEVEGAKRSTKVVRPRDGAVIKTFEGLAPAGDEQRTGAFWLWTSDFSLSQVEGGLTKPPIVFQAREEMSDRPRLESTTGLAWGPGNEGDLLFWEAKRGTLVQRLTKAFRPPFRCAALSPDGRTFALGGHSTELTWYRRDTGQQQALKGHLYEVDSIGFSPDSKLFVSSGVEGRLLMWNAETGESLGQLGRHSTSAGQVAFSSDGRVVACLEPGVGIHVWHLQTRREVDLIPLSDQSTDEWLSFSPDGKWLGTRANGGIIHLYPIDAP